MSEFVMIWSYDDKSSFGVSSLILSEQQKNIVDHLLAEMPDFPINILFQEVQRVNGKEEQ